MTIDEAIAREIQLAKEQRSHIGTWDDEYSKKCEVYAEEHEQLAVWLEELKSNRIALEKANGYLEVNHRLGYNKAIDDLYNALADDLTWLMNFGDEVYINVGNSIRIRAEQLKAGGEDEAT